MSPTGGKDDGTASAQPQPGSSCSGPDELGRGRNNLRTQRILRSTAREDDTQLETVHSDRFVNALEFDAYNHFLKADNVYAPHALYETPYVRATDSGCRYHSVTETEIRKMDLAAARARLAYLSEPQSRLLTHDDFRLVFRRNGPPRATAGLDRSFGCALAGLTGFDLLRVYRSLDPGLEDVRERPRCTDRQLLDACKADGLIADYASSGRLAGVRGLNEHLRENAATTSGARLILSQSADPGAVCGHAVVLKHFVDSGTYERIPQKVLIDFQVPGMMRVINMNAAPNPLRFTSHVDTATYSTFVVYAVCLNS